MKRCPKCSRTYPDDNQKFCTFDGGLLVAPTFDPNATIQSTTPPPLSDEFMTRNLATTVVNTPAPTGDVNRPTSPNVSERLPERPSPPPVSAAPPPQQPPQPASAPLRAPAPAPPAARVGPAAVAPAKKSKLPLILGILLLLLVLGVGALAVLFIFVVKPRLDEAQTNRSTPTRPDTNRNTNSNSNSNTNTATEPTTTSNEVAPPNTTQFVNSSSNLDGKLADHYLDFSFYYPESWQTDPKAGIPGASNFVKVERRLPPDFTQENFAVGWYTSKGTFEADKDTFPQLVELLGSSLSRGFPGYQKVSEGPTKVNSLDAYEFRFVSVSKGTEKGDIDLWGRVIFVPTGVSGNQTGATMILLATSLAPELSGVNDVGEKGEMPVILESFRFGKKP